VPRCGCSRGRRTRRSKGLHVMAMALCSSRFACACGAGAVTTVRHVNLTHVTNFATIFAAKCNALQSALNAAFTTHPFPPHSFTFFLPFHSIPCPHPKNDCIIPLLKSYAATATGTLQMVQPWSRSTFDIVSSTILSSLSPSTFFVYRHQYL